MCQDWDQGLADSKFFCGHQLWFTPLQAFKLH